MNLEEYEPHIRAVVRRYASKSADIDYLEALGRVTVVKILGENPASPWEYVEGVLVSKFASYCADNNLQSRGNPFELDLTSDLLREFHNKLRRQFGKKYVAKISGKRNSREVVRTLFKSLIERVYHIPVEDIPKQVNYPFFADTGVEPLLWAFYGNSPMRAIMDIYPDSFVPFEFAKKPNGFWKGRSGQENALAAMKWFVGRRKLTLEDCAKITTDDFVEEELGGMLQYQFNHSPYLALKTQFPQLKPWNLIRTPQGYYGSRENQLTSLLAYLEEKGFPSIAEFNPEEVYELGLRTGVTKEDMCDLGFRGLLRPFGNSLYRTFNELLPGKILPWTLLGVKEPWREDPRKTAGDAIKWLFDNYLMIPTNKIPDYASVDLFWKVGFSGIMTNRHIGISSSPFRAVELGYPGVFSKKDFNRNFGERLLVFPCSEHKKSRK